MNPRLAAALIALLSLFVLIAWIAGFFTTKIDPELIGADAANVDPASVVTVVAVDAAMSDAIPASVRARDNTVVAARILSTVDAVNVRAGALVAKGDVLVTLDQAGLRSRVEQAREQVNAVAAQLDEARRQLSRLMELRAQGLSTQAELDQARASVEALTAQNAQAQQALSEAEIVLGYATVKAPIAGRVVERMVEPGDTVAPGAPLITLYDPASLQAQASVPETRSLSLEVGQTIEISIPSLQSASQGVIEEIVPAADAASRTFLVKVAIDYDPKIRPGMFARFHIPLAADTVMAVPPACLGQVGQLDVVEVLEEGRIVRRFVRLGRTLPDRGLVEVISGVEAGEQLVCP